MIATDCNGKRLIAPLLRQAFALQAHNKAHHTRTLSSLAHLAVQRGNRPAARRLLDRALALDPGCGVAYLQLGDLAQDDDAALFAGGSTPGGGGGAEGSGGDNSALATEDDAHTRMEPSSPEARKMARVGELYSQAVDACAEATAVDHEGAWGASPLVIAA